MKFGIISDTHSVLDARFLEFFKMCDEIIHAGDIGDLKVLEGLQAHKPTVAVYGNIDGAEARRICKEEELIERNGKKIYITHIAGYPGRFNALAKKAIQKHKPDIFIAGHSHILKVIFDKQNNFLFINPGAAGNHGWHKVKTAIRFDIDNGEIKNLEILEVKR
jgi:putative phosphoesterase